jgi:hypothetical protein
VNRKDEETWYLILVIEEKEALGKAVQTKYHIQPSFQRCHLVPGILSYPKSILEVHFVSQRLERFGK